MSNKSANALTNDEWAEFDSLQAEIIRTANANARAVLIAQSATQDLSEFVQNMKRKYRLREGDRIEEDGTLTRFPPVVPVAMIPSATSIALDSVVAAPVIAVPVDNGGVAAAMRGLQETQESGALAP
jgi:hypothetical protein